MSKYICSGSQMFGPLDTYKQHHTNLYVPVGTHTGKFVSVDIRLHDIFVFIWKFKQEEIYNLSPYDQIEGVVGLNDNFHPILCSFGKEKLISIRWKTATKALLLACGS